MAEKLSESTWTAFAKKRELDDAALVKALKAFDKTDESKPEPRVDALGTVIAEIKKLVTALPKRKPPLPDKEAREVKDKLYDLMDLAEGLQKEARAAMTASDDEEESPALLTTKMVPLLRELRKGDARMHTLICLAGKETSVLIMRRQIAPARRKLLAEAVDAKAGMKYVAGEVLQENGALTFVVQSAAGGLAKRLRAALLSQVQMRLKVRVRGDDGEEADGEDEDGPPTDGGTDGDPTAQVPQPPEAPQPPSGEALAYTQRLNKVRPAIEQALRNQHPEATRLRAVLALAAEKAATGDHATAIKALASAETLLARRGEPPPGGGVDPGVAFNSRLAALMPAIKKALAAPGPAAGEIKLKVSEAGALAKQGDFGRAGTLLDEVEGLLAGKPVQREGEPKAPPQGGTGGNPYETLVAQLQPQLDKVESLPLGPELAKQLQQVRLAWDMAKQSADGGNLDRATTILQRLADGGLLARLMQAAQGPQAGAGGSEGGREGIAAYRTALVEMRNALDAVQGRIADLGRAIPTAMPEEAEFARTLSTALQEYGSSLLEVVDEAIGVAEDPAQPVTRELASMLTSMLQDLKASPLVRHVDSNPFGVKVDAGKSLQGALKKVLAALPAGAL